MRKYPRSGSLIVRNSDCQVCRMLEERLLRAVFRGVRCGETTSTHLIQLTSKKQGWGNRLLGGEGLRVYRHVAGLVFIEAKSCAACRVFSRSACIPRQAIYVPGMGVVFNVLVPGPGVLRDILERLRAEGKLVEIMGDFTPIPKGMTRKQGQVLLTAIRMGYLNMPRECRLRDIAEALGLSSSTVSRQLKAALKKLALDALLMSGAPLATEEGRLKLIAPLSPRDSRDSLSTEEEVREDREDRKAIVSREYF
jgi:DNA-binding transcriptional ArsR family regulator